MQQPELGQRLTAIRKEQNLTQEDLVAKSNVSVRTIQRIESGEVLPRMSTVKILLAALGVEPESILNKPAEPMETKKNPPPYRRRNTVLAAALAGVVYLICEIILGAMDIAWMLGHDKWEFWMNATYTGLTIVMVCAFTLFAFGFITLATVFENSLLKSACYLLIVATAAVAVLNVTALSVDDFSTLWFPYTVAAIVFGAIGIVFGISLMRLQDSMGELSRIAGILEILMGVLFITVVLFFLTWVVLIPAVILEVLVLYRGYEYLSRPDPVQPAS